MSEENSGSPKKIEEIVDDSTEGDSPKQRKWLAYMRYAAFSAIDTAVVSAAVAAGGAAFGVVDPKVAVGACCIAFAEVAIVGAGGAVANSFAGVDKNLFAGQFLSDISKEEKLQWSKTGASLAVIIFAAASFGLNAVLQEEGGSNHGTTHQTVKHSLE
ncbi:MAG TPA: hypothetical protein PLK94_05320 [Alphaproteobacteria bacterium]|nr:hypothetical protein [Alphaproteobacteria bacterium]HOO50694.1 hypothetical protein [Alphaproteobacteria bacterium]